MTTAVFSPPDFTSAANGTAISPSSSAVNTVSPRRRRAPFTGWPAASIAVKTCPDAQRRSVTRRRPLRTSARLEMPAPEHSTT